MGESLYRALFSSAAPSSVCLRKPGGRSLNYADLDARAGAFATAIVEAGCSQGARLVAQVDKSCDAFALYLACLRAGVIYVPLNTAYTPTEVRFFVEDAQPTLVVCRPSKEEALRESLRDMLSEGCFVHTLGANDDGSLAEAATTAATFRPVEVSDSDIACMLYTSGTTGRSKGAMLSHQSLISNACVLHKAWGFVSGDVLLHVLPIFHVHGLFVALNVIMMGGHEVLFLDRFDIDQIFSWLPHASVFMGVPTHYARLLADERFGPSTCENVRLFTSGSAPMSEQTHSVFTKRTGQQICERYGMTECGIITSNPYRGARIPGTVGYALPGYEVRVVDGIVQVKGKHLFSGYWRQPEKTRAAFTSDGWFITGDVGSISEDGRVRLRGRASDLIISGGYNIYPKEIELVINGVTGVSESAVIGVPHPDFGEGVLAITVLTGAVAQSEVESVIRARCNALLARFKQPKRWVFVDELPRNAMGKVQKNLLRARYASALLKASSKPTEDDN